MSARFKDLQVSRFAEEGAELELVDPAGKRTGWKWRLRGTDAPSMQALALGHRRRRLEQLARTGEDRVDPATFDEEALEQMVAATLSWEGCELEDGVPFECNPPNVRAALAEKWIREQVAEFIRKRANFLHRSASAS